MTQEQKELLLKDLCARLPYGVRVQFNYIITSPAIIKGIYKDLIECDIAECELEDIKPYLFPLSSMTEGQRKEWQSLMIKDSYGILYYTVESYDYLYKNHIDIRGLISMGLANDATELNIY